MCYTPCSKTCLINMQVKLLFEENSLLDEENKKLLMKYRKEKNSHGSSGKHANSTSTKVRFRTEMKKSIAVFHVLPFLLQRFCHVFILLVCIITSCLIYLQSNKRKSSSKTSSPIEKKIDFSDVDNTARQPLSPLRFNSPDSRVHN